MSAFLPLPEKTTLPDFQIPRKPGNNSILQPVPLPIPGEAKATFKAACLLAHQIYCDLATGRRHYRNRDGHLLTTLDEITAAIINDQLLTQDQITP